jgi:hypothetical protein
MTATLAPAGTYDHLLDLTDDVGTFEHAEHARPRREHGYCVDDVARALIVVCREPDPGPDLLVLARTSFRFLTTAQAVDGRTRNRRAAGRRWSGRHAVGDAWGRSLWAFGTAARRAPERWMNDSALASFERGCEQRSPWPRAMAFAALGAAEVVVRDPHHRRARELLADAARTIGRPAAGTWSWPEPRLHYANAALAEAVLVAGDVLARPELVDDGLTMLGWLLGRETVGTHLSPTPTGGAGPDDHPPRFDQQPIEAAAMADACLRAAAVTGDTDWLRGVDLATGWFRGDNDAGIPMSDPRTGGGYDGLHAGAANQNQGAESTIALILTRQIERALAGARG